MRLSFYILVCLLVTYISVGETYELHLLFEPNDASVEVELKLRHPFNDSTNNPNYGIYKDCDKNNVEPEWGLASYEGDNPKLVIDSIAGGSKITASRLNDPGNCSPVVSVTHGTATCSLEIINWPEMETVIYTKIISAGDPDWVLTNLFCTKDMGLSIIKAKQKNNNELKIKAEFAEFGLLEKDVSTFQASLESNHESRFWVNLDSPQWNKINKAGTIGKFGKPIEAIVKNKNVKKQKMILKKVSKNMFKNDILNVFVTFNNGWSGFQQIQLDDKGKYKAPK